MDNDLKLIEENIKLLHNLSLGNHGNNCCVDEVVGKSLACRKMSKSDRFNELESEGLVDERSSQGSNRSLDTLEMRNFRLEGILNENLILKKAISKLSEMTQGFERAEKDNNELRELMQKLETENYLIRIQLQKVLDDQREIEQEKEVF
jgi:hypothetical protein